MWSKQVNVVIYFLLVKVQTMPMQWSCRQQKAVSVAFSEAISVCSCCCKLLMVITVLARKLPLLSSLPLNLVPYMWCMQSSGAARFWGPIISSNPEFWQNCLPGDGLGAALCWTDRRRRGWFLQQALSPSIPGQAGQVADWLLAQK